MKNTLLSFGMIGLTGIFLSSFAFMQKGDATQEQKKTRQIKMIKTENGKTMELDTVLTGDDVFVWHGDTINPDKYIKKFNASGFGKMHQVHVTVDPENGNEKVMILKHRGGKAGDPVIWQMDSGEDMEIITEDCDSLGKKVVIRKVKKGGDADYMTFFDGKDMNAFPPPPPPPPVPPVPPMKMMKMRHAGQSINLNDPNIVSYKKKDIKGGMEKIEIIRKKTEDVDNLNFDFEFNDELTAPEAPGFNWKSERDSLRMKIIEKKKVIKGKDGREVEVKVETQENK
jgi:hypothetical protein